MLAAANRLADASSFREVTRRGRRAASRSLVVHLLLPVGDVAPRAAGPAASSQAPLVGLVVSRAVGNAVVRNLVKRRLRHLLRGAVAGLPPGARVVVRALPASATASSAVLAHDLDRGLAKVLAAGDGR